MAVIAGDYEVDFAVWFETRFDPCGCGCVMVFVIPDWFGCVCVTHAISIMDLPAKIKFIKVS